MSCDCGCCEEPTVFDEARPRAAKRHRCSDCGRAIEVGTVHRRVKGLWDGQWATYRYCGRCERVRARILDIAGFVHFEDARGRRPGWWEEAHEMREYLVQRMGGIALGARDSG